MPHRPFVALVASFLLSLSAAIAAQERIHLPDIQHLAPVAVTAEELRVLLPGARLSRISERGIEQSWVNEADGRMQVASAGRRGRTNLEPGTWRIDANGDFCVSIEWHGDRPEQWCRPIVRTSDGTYYTVDRNKRVRRYVIEKR